MNPKNFTLFKLHFTSPLHLAKGKSEYDSSEDILHSDTLKSALAVCALQLYEDKNVKEFLESFKISSAFPFYKDELFFPKPNFLNPETQLFTFENDEKQKVKQRKKVKKIKWIGKEYFIKLLKGVPLKFDDKKYQNETFLSEKLTKEDKIYTSETQERVQIPRVLGESEDTQPYYVDRLYFDKNAGLFFLLETKDKDIITKIENCLKLLGDNGLGTDKNVGNGQFSFSKENLDLPMIDDANYQINLSLYCPDNEELQIIKDKRKNLSYNLIKRGGWLASPENPDHISLRKKSIFMFGEGSIFPKNNKDLEGKIVDLKPENEKLKEMKVSINHEIYRDGKSIFLGMKI